MLLHTYSFCNSILGRVECTVVERLFGSWANSTIEISALRRWSNKAHRKSLWKWNWIAVLMEICQSKFLIRRGFGARIRAVTKRWTTCVERENVRTYDLSLFNHYVENFDKKFCDWKKIKSPADGRGYTEWKCDIEINDFLKFRASHVLKRKLRDRESIYLSRSKDII
jgi:hypothetical protein